MSPDESVRSQMQDIARGVQAQIPPGWGFAVFVFPMEGRDGLFNYVSNGRREDLVKTLEEFIEKSKASFGKHAEEAI